MRQLVFIHKTVSYEYFMDELEYYELDLLLENCAYTSKISWEQARWEVWASLSPYLKKQDQGKSLEKLFPLMTDKDVQYEIEKTEVTKDEKRNFADLVKQFNEARQKNTD